MHLLQRAAHLSRLPGPLDVEGPAVLGGAHRPPLGARHLFTELNRLRTFDNDRTVNVAIHIPDHSFRIGIRMAALGEFLSGPRSPAFGQDFAFAGAWRRSVPLQRRLRRDGVWSARRIGVPAATIKSNCPDHPLQNGDQAPGASRFKGQFAVDRGPTEDSWRIVPPPDFRRR